MKVLIYSYRDEWYAEIRDDADFTLELSTGKSPKAALAKLKDRMSEQLNRYKEKLSAVEAFETNQIEELGG